MNVSGETTWYSPIRCLVLFCIINILTYLDRGILAGNAVKSSIANQYDLNNFQYFLLPSVFMVGLLVTSPIFAQLTHTHNPLRLIGVGLAVWTFATLGCSLAWSYQSLFFFRALVGVGEASFCSLAGPMINDAAPPGSKSTWLAVFYMCVPSGIALGYVTGGVLFTLTASWRISFLAESLCMVPFVAFGLLANSQPFERRHEAAPTSSAAPLLRSSSPPDTNCDAHSDEGAHSSRTGRHESPAAAVAQFFSRWMQDTRVVASHRVFSCACVGYIAYTATCGVLINAGPSAAAAMFPSAFQGWLSIDEFFGMVTIITGVVGTAGGGVLLDRVMPTMRGAFTVAAVSSGAAAVLLALCFSIRCLELFVAFFVAAELALFAVSGPVNAGYLWSVPHELRPLACALTTVAIHVLGDVPSPPLAGKLVDYLIACGYTDSLAWTTTMMVSFTGVALSTAAWGTAAVLAQSSHDYGIVNDDTVHDVHEQSVEE